MLFNSLEFTVFLPIVLLFFTILSGRALRVFLIAVSYVFYGWANPYYCILLFLSTVLDFNVGQRIHKSDDERKRKRLLMVSIFGNIGILALFKYSGFFITSTNSIVETFLGVDLALVAPQIILPIGISFYTFQTLSYTIDIYRRQMDATDNFSSFALFVAFFPQLVAGPIERARHLLPQLHEKQPRTTEDMMIGLTRILWGLTKKVVFADNIAVYVNAVYDASAITDITNPEIILGTWLFAFQIYFDFSAYSDIAIGIARMMGIHLNENFLHPYLSRNIGEFWRRWHVSLSTWLRDYLYIPLGGSRKGLFFAVINVVIVFFLGGLWHGADAKFIIWGLWIGFTIGVYNIVTARLKIKHDYKRPIALHDIIGIMFTFQIIAISWVFFRADSVDVAVTMLQSLINNDTWTQVGVLSESEHTEIYRLLIFVIILHFIRGMKVDIAARHIRNPYLIGLFWAILIAIMIVFHADSTEQFIYFQF